MSKGLIIFARAPVPGKVKTRLARDVGEQVATELYGAMLDDVLEMAALLDDVRLLVFWADGSYPHFPGIPRLEMFEQSGEDLGQRMANAFRTAFEEGIDACCIIGSDLPDLPLEYVRKAFRMLEENRIDAVFGPSSDGGYYLLGMRRLWPELFENVPWSTSLVLETSLKHARASELTVDLLPVWHDIDTIDDLKQLALFPGKSSRTGCLLQQMPAILNFLTSSGGTP